MSSREMPGAKSLLPAVLQMLARESGDGELLTVVWADLVGAQIATATRPLKLSNGVLEIEVREARWARELNDRKPELLSRLQEVLGRKAPRELTFRFAGGP